MKMRWRWRTSSPRCVYFPFTIPSRYIGSHKSGVQETLKSNLRGISVLRRWYRPIPLHSQRVHIRHLSRPCYLVSRLDDSPADAL